MSLYYEIVLLVLFILGDNIRYVTCSYQSILTPLYPNHNRTAIILTGQVRSGNIAFLYGMTPIQSQLKHFIEPIAIFGGVDMFIYIQIKRSNKSKAENVKDLQQNTESKLCEMYSKHPIFALQTGNKVYCLSEYEKDLLSPFVESFPIWKLYCFYNLEHVNIAGVKNGLLQQLYGMYRANLAAKQYATVNNIEYKYKVRLRPDIFVVKPIQSIDSFVFHNRKMMDVNMNSDKFCHRFILFSNKIEYGDGAEDSFNMGFTMDMDILLDRYINFISGEKEWMGIEKEQDGSSSSSSNNSNNSGESFQWSAESYLIGLLSHQKHKICLDSEKNISMILTRTPNHIRRFSEPEIRNNNPWKKSSP